MSPKSLVFLLVVGLCATQMASGHRQARSVADLMDSAQQKLGALIDNVKDAAASSVETVFNYATKLESRVLDAGTQRLAKQGIDLDLHDLVDLLKSNVKTCANDDDVKTEVLTIVGSVASCVTNDVSKIQSLVGNMKNLWNTAKGLPGAIADVGAQCTVHGEVDENTNILEDDDDEDHDLQEETQQLIQTASHHLSKRALWDLKRVTRCVKSVYSLAKNDLIVIPGEIVATTASAAAIVQSAQSGIPACVGTKVAQSAPAITKLALKVGACVASGISEGEDLDNLIETSPSLKVLKQLSALADKMEDLQNSGVISAAQSVASALG